MQVLLVEDSPGDARLIEEMLREVPGAPFQSQRSETLAGATAMLAGDSFDVVLLDLGLPDAQGIDTLQRTRTEAPHVPIVVLTGFDDEERAMQALQHGAQDYLVKGKIESETLGRAIRYAVERYQVEETLRETVRELEARTEEMESFTYSVSHDLKEPLRTLEAFSQFLIEDYGDVVDDQGRDYLGRLSKASARLKDMIEKLLVLSRLGQRTVERERVSVQEVVQEIILSAQAMIDEKQALVSIDGSLPEVSGDLPRVEQIFGNLVGNALKFNEKNKAIVSIGLSEVTNGAVTFYVRDNGIGIAPEYHERIFGIFQRLHLREDYEGSGAGLAIVKRAAEALGGCVWLESALGAGTTFYVQLPAWDASGRNSGRTRKTGGPWSDIAA